MPNTYMSQSPTLKLHLNLSHSHHQRRVTLLQHLTATILQLKVFPKRNLITLEAANTTYAPIPILIIQKYTDIDLCKTLF